MKPEKKFCIIGIILLMIFAGGCAAPTAVEKKAEVEKKVIAEAKPPKTLAILPFENNSITEPEKYAPLGKGLAAMLITDLKNAGTSLKLIERTQIQNILKEIALSQSGSVDQATAVQAGRILGAQSIAFGSFMVIGEQVRIDTRIVKVETSELMMAESIDGSSKDFIGLEKALAKKIAKSLQVVLSPIGTGAKSDINAALYFSQGLDALDRGDKAAAKALFEKAVDADPAYRVQVDQVLK